MPERPSFLAIRRAGYHVHMIFFYHFQEKNVYPQHGLFIAITIVPNPHNQEHGVSFRALLRLLAT